MKHLVSGAADDDATEIREAPRTHDDGGGMRVFSLVFSLVEDLTRHVSRHRSAYNT